MEENNISISSDKERAKNISDIHTIIQNKSTNSQPSMTNNTIENININNNNSINIKSNNNSSINILNFINEMPFENLNDYYDIESSLFLKRVEKLNLKFYWTSECVLNQQDIKYPYNKLFLILFKQISLYIEEIARLNKQLKQKNKIEKHFQIKIAQMKQKEKENTLNKQMLKNLQRDNKILEKKNEKYKSEIEKLNKKLSEVNKNFDMNSLSNTTTNALLLNKYNKNFFLGSPKMANVPMGFDSLIMNNTSLKKKGNKFQDLSINNDNNKYTINVNNKNKEKRISNSIDESNCYNKNQNKNSIIINQGLMQCEEEIENLDLIENILKDFKNKNINHKSNKNNSSNNVGDRNHINFNNIIQGKRKKEKIYNNSGIPIKKHFHYSYKSDDFSKK